MGVNDHSAQKLKNPLHVESPAVRILGLGMLFALCIVWQLPHVIALRYLLIIMLTVLYAPAALTALWRAPASSVFEPSPRLLFLVYTAFLSWLLVVAALISNEPAQSFQEIRGEWLSSTLCLLFGFGAGVACSSTHENRGGAALWAVFWGLVCHAGLQLAFISWMLVQHGDLQPTFRGIGDHPANVTYTNGLALAILLAGMIVAPSAHVGFPRMGSWLRAFVYGLLFLSTLASQNRNGVVVFLALTAIGGLVLAFRFRTYAPRKWWSALAICLAVVAIGTFLGLKSDPRWQRFLTTVPIAWDIDSNRAWVNSEKYPVPLAADGSTLDVSTYERIAYVRVAWRLVVGHPMGTEISRDAFRKLLEREHPDLRTDHAHNGYLDMALSAGQPGLALWLVFLSTAIWYGVRHYRRTGNAYAIALVLLVCAFALRGALDSIFRDHIVEEFMLCAGLLTGCLHAASANYAWR